MMQLGTDGAGAEIRAKMQSANLMSDMESFKVSPVQANCQSPSIGFSSL